jgi:acyl carrier protein
MDITIEVVRLLDEILSLKGRSSSFSRATPLLGAIPELDSMAVVSLITGMEDRFGIVIEDSDVDGDIFTTVGSLSDFVADKLERQAAP